MQVSNGTLIEENSQRDVRCLDLNGQNFYLKRTKSEKLSSAFESYFRGRLAHSKPYKEMLQFRLLAQLDLDIAEVVAAGEELSYGIPVKGFILTREVPGQDLSLVYRAAGNKDRRHIMKHFGSLIGRLHGNGFFGSTRLKDIISAGCPGDSPTLTLIDRETRNPYPKNIDKNKVISRLLLNIRRQTQQGEVFTDKEWDSFVKAYCSSLPARLSIDAKDLLFEILTRLNQSGKRQLPQ